MIRASLPFDLTYPTPWSGQMHVDTSDQLAYATFSISSYLMGMVAAAEHRIKPCNFQLPDHTEKLHRPKQERQNSFTSMPDCADSRFSKQR